MQMPPREVGEGPCSQSHIPQGGDFTGLKVLAQVCWDSGARLGVGWRFLGDEQCEKVGVVRVGGLRGTHKKPGSAGSDLSRAGRALQLRFRGGASPT